MTTIVSFIAKSDGGKKSLYVLSDSRIRWNFSAGKSETFDYSTKIFPFNRSPDILAYCGDSTFSLSALSRIKTQLEFSNQFKNIRQPEGKAELILKYLNSALKTYPLTCLFDVIQICYFTYYEKEFFGYEFETSAKTDSKFKIKTIEIPDRLGVIYTSGTGAGPFKNKCRQLTTKFGETVHSFFFSFYCHIKSGIDGHTGGPPQVVMIDSTGKLKPIAIVIDKKLFFLGEENDFWFQEKDIDFRNERFELLDSEGVKFSHEKNRGHLRCS